ncbi:uncharacterized protein LOC142885689 isoform X1 [Nelusetta ayraudi]|uniref:uncharacterized protein LOC142885689 isoform X1 n=1 Tax=Nelusetta ayraudi TaxID=303726 RepID=UPI003F6F7979
MEHNAIQWVGAPSCQRGSYAFYKSVSSSAPPDGPVQVWRLGEFYFIRCGPQDPVCVAEVTLLWEDQTRRHLLASTRLYFLPEDTPKGRTKEHGEDEVLAVSRKMVVPVEDLVRWSCGQPADWCGSQKGAPRGTNGLHKSPQGTDENGDGNSSDPLKVETEGPLLEVQGIRVLSYPQYCRFRSLQKRIQDAATSPEMQNPHVMALGGVKAPPTARLMYCRDTFSHPMLENNSNFSWQFRCPSLSLRGRPRKRRGRDGKESPTSSQSEAWIDKMKENVMGSVEAGCEGSWLPHPEEQLFLDQLFSFMDRHGSPIHKVPNLGFKKIDLFLMYTVVRRLGGYKKVTMDRLWKVVYNELGGCPGSTSAATCTRRHYERLVLPYEEHLRAGGGGADFKIPESPAPPKPRAMRGRKPLPRGRRPGTKNKEKSSSAPSPPPQVAPSGGGAVKRGRGRPPGTRNKATLIAQAKLLNKVKTAADGPRAVPLPNGNATRPAQTAVLPISMPLTPELSPLLTPLLPFQPKPQEPKADNCDSPVPPAGLLISALPRQFVGGSLAGFSPIKGVCPLDVFRNCVGLQRAPDSAALTPQDPSKHLPAIFTLQPKGGTPDTPPPSVDQPQVHTLLQQHNRCSGCSADGEAAQRGPGRDQRSRPSLPPLRVLPLNLDCSVQVCQLMKTRLGSTQFQTFTRRLSEVLSQDLGSKPPCGPITPPPEQALPLNLSKRLKRPEGSDLSPAAANGNAEQPPAKRAKTCAEAMEDQSEQPGCQDDGGATTGGEVKNQEEPADLSSPSRIRAFLLGLPPFQVKFEEDLNGSRLGKLPPTGPKPESPLEKREGGGVVKEEVKEAERVNKLLVKSEQEEAELPAAVTPLS